MNETWIKIFTKFLNWEWYKDQNTKALFIHCLLKANWKEGKFEGNLVPRGSFVTSLQSLAEELDMSVQMIRTSLKHLISTGELTSKNTNKFRIITIKNYDLYQQVNKQTNNQLTSNQQTTNNQLTSSFGHLDKNNFEIGEFSTSELTSTLTNEINGLNDISNKQINNQLTINQQATNNQLTTIEEYIEYKNNSVCNNTHVRDEDLSCHLGCIYKTIDCKNCMKKWKCSLPDDPMFKSVFGKTFYEYVAEIERRKLEIARELETIKDNTNQDFEIFDLFDEEDERD